MLYAHGGSFACRRCSGLAYASQKIGAGDRASSKTNRLRRRLGRPAFSLTGAASPWGMHWKTYRRLKAAHDAVMLVALNDMGRKLGIFIQLLVQ